jgi:hypothetical protein
MNAKLSKLRSEHEALLMRFVGVSDPLLKEQLGDDLVNLENEISILEVTIKQSEREEEQKKQLEREEEQKKQLEREEEQKKQRDQEERETEIIPDITHDEWDNKEQTDNDKSDDLNWTTAEEIKLQADKLKKDLYNFYEKQFIPADIITCIEKTNNVDLRSIIKKMRIRIPADLTQRKELCNLLDAINKQLIVLDYESVIIDTIGKEAPPIKIYCNCFTRFGEISYNTVYQ